MPTSYGQNKKNRTTLPDFEVNTFEGLNTSIKDKKALTKGLSPDSLNWLTGRFKDHIELRRGSALLGTTRVSGNGKVTGIGIGIKYDGTEVPFFSYGQKVKYYNSVSGDTAEVGTNILPTAASGEDVSFAPVQSIAGAFMYISSPNSSLYKIPVANPASSIDLGPTDYRGRIQSYQNRLILWNRLGTNGIKDLTGLYFSKLDKHLFSSDYPAVTGEAIGSSGSTTYSGTLAFKASHPKASCFQVVITEATGEVMTDDKNGALVGSAGSTGTINYATGAYSVTFNHVTVGAVTAGYFWEDSSGSTPQTTSFAITGVSLATSAVVTVASHTLNVGDLVYIAGISGTTQLNGNTYTVTAITATTITINVNSTAFTAWSSGGTIQKNSGAGGIADFTFNVTSRYAGDGNIIRQDDGGGSIQSVVPFIGIQYAFHIRKVWQTSTSSDDLTYANTSYRTNLGIPFHRAAFTSDVGIIFIDTFNPSQAVIRRLEIQKDSVDTTVVPVSKSDALDLSSNGFDYGTAFRWGDYEVIACQSMTNGVNDSFNSIVYMRNIYSDVWDRMQFGASCFATYQGSLLAGDPNSSNVFTMFSGFDDDGFPVNNYWTSGQMDCGIDSLKRFNRLVVEGLIGKSQSIDVLLSYDGGPYVKAFTISGDADYVDNSPTSIGNYTLGSKIIGGSGGSTLAYAFEGDFGIYSDIFHDVSVKFQATGIGFAQINKFKFKDGRFKGRKDLPTRIVG